MSGTKPEEEELLVDYDELDDQALNNQSADKGDDKKKQEETKKGSYVGIHTTGFRDFLLRSELLMAITDCGFEHPSEVQQECIPQAVYGADIICQAKAGMGKTAVFVLATLQQIVPVAGQVDTVVLCHTRELAYQICDEYLRFSKHMQNVKVSVFYGGVPYDNHKKLLQQEVPNIVVGTPGRILQLVKDGLLKLDNIKRFILDECDSLLESLDMRRDVQRIFKSTPHAKQVMMFSATLSKDIRGVCRMFTQSPLEIYVDDESKLTLHGLQQYFVKLQENQKNRKLNDLLDALEFNQVVIFVNGVRRAKELNKLLREYNFPSICMHGDMEQTERLKIYNEFKAYKSRILVSTDIFGRGVDFERVNIVINYDMPSKADSYLHRVGRSGRFGTKGLAISFVATKEDEELLQTVQSRLKVLISNLPDEIDVSTYMNA